MIVWIKIALVAVGLLVTSGLHIYFKGKPVEKIADEVIEKVVEETTGVSIEPYELDIDDILDSDKK